MILVALMVVPRRQVAGTAVSATNVLLALNLFVVLLLLFRSEGNIYSYVYDTRADKCADTAEKESDSKQSTASGVGASPNSRTDQEQPSFLSVALTTSTDKVRGTTNMPHCNDPETDKCQEGKHENCCKFVSKNPRCRVWGHFYDSMYQKYLEPYNPANNPQPFQFLEIGYSNGAGFQTFHDYLVGPSIDGSSALSTAGTAAELHSMEIKDLWSRNRRMYDTYKDANRLHLGDASDFSFLNTVWTTHMKRPDGTAPPLKVVVDDASHMSKHIVTSVFFWFPRIAPGGMLIVEDIQPSGLSDAFRTQFLPQLMRDLHSCGSGGVDTDQDYCFPTLQPLLNRIDCEMHICVFERNDLPALDLDEKASAPPPNALNMNLCFNRGKTRG